MGLCVHFPLLTAGIFSGLNLCGRCVLSQSLRVHVCVILAGSGRFRPLVTLQLCGRWESAGSRGWAVSSSPQHYCSVGRERSGIKELPILSGCIRRDSSPSLHVLLCLSLCLSLFFSPPPLPHPFIPSQWRFSDLFVPQDHPSPSPRDSDSTHVGPQNLHSVSYPEPTSLLTTAGEYWDKCWRIGRFLSLQSRVWGVRTDTLNPLQHGVQWRRGAGAGVEKQEEISPDWLFRKGLIKKVALESWRKTRDFPDKVGNRRKQKRERPQYTWED